jgi:hypothetical protein
MYCKGYSNGLSLSSIEENVHFSEERKEAEKLLGKKYSIPYAAIEGDNMEELQKQLSTAISNGWLFIAIEISEVLGKEFSEEELNFLMEKAKKDGNLFYCARIQFIQNPKKELEEKEILEILNSQIKAEKDYDLVITTASALKSKKRDEVIERIAIGLARHGLYSRLIDTLELLGRKPNMNEVIICKLGVIEYGKIEEIKKIESQIVFKTKEKKEALENFAKRNAMLGKKADISDAMTKEALAMALGIKPSQRNGELSAVLRACVLGNEEFATFWQLNYKGEETYHNGILKDFINWQKKRSSLEDF